MLEKDIKVNWKEITLQDYKTYQLLDDDKKKEWNTIIKTFFPNKYKDMQVKDINRIDDDSIMNITSEFAKFIEVEGQIYVFNFQELKFGEFIDLNNYMNDGFWNNSEKILSVFYRPVVKFKGLDGYRYRFYKYLLTKVIKIRNKNKQEVAKQSIYSAMSNLKCDYELYDTDTSNKIQPHMLKLPMTYVQWCSVFFLTFMVMWSKDTLNSSKEEMMKEM